VSNTTANSYFVPSNSAAELESFRDNGGTLSGVTTYGFGTATYIGTDATTKGNWIGVYGTQGYNVIGKTASYPAYATVSVTGNSSFTWAASTADIRGLQWPGAPASRIAACWYSSSTLTIDINMTGGLSHTLSLYLLDWDTNGRVDQITIKNAETGTILYNGNLGTLNGGQYARWTVRGHITVAITKAGATNGVVSGIFFDP
jgi:hypothetical protein